MYPRIVAVPECEEHVAFLEPVGSAHMHARNDRRSVRARRWRLRHWWDGQHIAT
jgi:hypothetical protein